MAVVVVGPYWNWSGLGRLVVYTWRKSLPARNGAADLKAASFLVCETLRWRWLNGGPLSNFDWLVSLPFLSNREFFGSLIFLGFCRDFNLLGGLYCMWAVAISLSSGLKCCLFCVCSTLCNSSGVPSESSPVGTRGFPSLWNVPYSELCKAATA